MLRVPSRRTRVLIWLGRRFGACSLLSTVAGSERAGRTMYDAQPEARGTSLPGDERSHARVLTALSGTAEAGVAGGTLARLEGRHRMIGGNALRASVLGANDGLVSNLTLVMGVAGATLGERRPDRRARGPVGRRLVDGDRGVDLGPELARAVRARDRDRGRGDRRDPRGGRGGARADLPGEGPAGGAGARARAPHLANEEAALHTLAREELGIEPEEMGGSPWTAAGASFLLFALGAGIALITGRGVWFSGLRQLVLGLAAAGITFVIGRLLGVAIGG